MKRFTALLLALVLTVSMAATTFAAKPKPIGIADPEDYYDGQYSEWNYDLWLEDRQGDFLELGVWPKYDGKYDSNDLVADLDIDLYYDIYEGSTLYIRADWINMFTWEDGVEQPQREDYFDLSPGYDPDDPGAWLFNSSLGYSNLDEAVAAYNKAMEKYSKAFTLSVYERVKLRHTPSKFIDSVGWERYDGALPFTEQEETRSIVLAVHFIDDFVMTREVQQELEFWFNVGGKSYKDHGFTIDANVTFVEEVVVKNQRDAETYHDRLGGIVLEPLCNASGFVLNIGADDEDVFVTTNLFEGHKIYATAKLKWAEEFEPLFLNAERLLAIYTLRAANLYPNACRVRIDFPNPVAYVYDAEGKYIGTTREELPWSNMYFISEVKQDSIVPAVITPEAEKVQMNMSEYLYWLATGIVPDSAKIIGEDPAGDSGTLLS